MKVDNIEKIIEFLENKICIAESAELVDAPKLKNQLVNCLFKVQFLKRRKDGHLRDVNFGEMFVTLAELKSLVPSLIKRSERDNARLHIDLSPINQFSMVTSLVKLMEGKLLTIANELIFSESVNNVVKSFNILGDWRNYMNKLSSSDDSHKNYPTHIRKRRYNMLDVDCGGIDVEEKLNEIRQVFDLDSIDQAFLRLDTPSGGCHLIFNTENSIDLRKLFEYQTSDLPLEPIYSSSDDKLYLDHTKTTELFTLKLSADTIMYYGGQE